MSILRDQPAPRSTTVWAWRIGIVLALVGLWHVEGTQDEYWNLVIGSPAQVARRIGGWFVDPRWWGHLGATLEAAALGYLLGLTVALVLVALLAPNRRVAAFFAPWLAGLNALPKIALAPLFIFWFGTTLPSKVYFVASLICFIVLYGVLTGLRAIDPLLLDNARLYGASRLQLLREVYIPAILTWIFASLRLSWAWALLAAVVGEFLGANRGLGYVIAQGQQTLQVDIVIAGILVVASAAILFDRLLLRLERPLSKWRAF